MVSTGNVIGAYFASWSIYERNFNVWDMDVTKLSHINYAFANIKNGLAVLGDPYADVDRVNLGLGDSWDDPSDTLHGNFHQLFRLKQAARHLKVGLSIGGWSWSPEFSRVASNERAQKRFVASAVQLLMDLGLDYIDLDWEFPVVGGIDATAKAPNDGRNFAQLLEEFARQLRQHFPEPNQRPYVTVAMSCSPHVYEHYMLKEMEPWVEHFNLMCYDFSGPWSPVSEHMSNLHRRTPRSIGGRTNVVSAHSVEEAVEYYLRQGLPPTKLVLGIPLYGREFASSHGLQHPFQGVGSGSWEPGLVDYKDLPLPGYLDKWERTTNASFAYNPVSGSFVSYDDAKAVAYKMDYIGRKGLGGAMFWEISADLPSDDARSLLRTVDAWIGGPALNQSPNILCYARSRYRNVRDVPGCPQPTDEDLQKIPRVLQGFSRNIEGRVKMAATVRQCQVSVAGTACNQAGLRTHQVPERVERLLKCYNAPPLDDTLTPSEDEGPEWVTFEETKDSVSGFSLPMDDEDLLDKVFEMVHIPRLSTPKSHRSRSNKLLRYSNAGNN